MIIRAVTSFDVADKDNGSWLIASNGDLYFVKSKNVDSGMLEVHAATKESGYQDISHFATVLSPGLAALGTFNVA